MAIRDHLNGLWSDEDFEEGCPRDGEPRLSPAQLAIVSVQQFLLELPVRQAPTSTSAWPRRDGGQTARARAGEDPGLLVRPRGAGRVVGLCPDMLVLSAST